MTAGTLPDARSLRDAAEPVSLPGSATSVYSAIYSRSYWGVDRAILAKRRPGRGVGPGASRSETGPGLGLPGRSRGRGPGYVWFSPPKISDTEPSPNTAAMA